MKQKWGTTDERESAVERRERDQGSEENHDDLVVFWTRVVPALLIMGALSWLVGGIRF